MILVEIMIVVGRIMVGERGVDRVLNEVIT